MPLLKTSPSLFLAFSVAVVSLSAPPVLAEIYKWTDANGEVHFSDKAPKSKARKAETVELEVSEQKIDPQMEDYRRRNRKLIQAWDGERAENKKQQAEAAEKKKKHSSNCAALRSRLAYSRKAAALYVPQSGGERGYYSDKQKAAYESQMESLLRKHCR